MQRGGKSEVEMVDDLLTMLALGKCIWAMLSILCTRFCSWPIVWLVAVEVLQFSSFALKLSIWPDPVPGFDRNVLHADSDCPGKSIAAAAISIVALVQCVDEVVMLRREQRPWIRLAFLVFLPFVAVVGCWGIWMSQRDEGSPSEELFFVDNPFRYAKMLDACSRVVLFKVIVKQCLSYPSSSASCVFV